jgi:DNA-binding NtrC family response regulator
MGSIDTMESNNTVNVGVIDDESCLSEVYRKLFSLRGIDVSFIARDCRQAVDFFNETDPWPRVMLMDQRMPAMSGVEATKKVREINPGVKVIFVSVDADTKNEALGAGAVEFIKKPASRQSISYAVRKAGRRTASTGSSRPAS